MIFDSANRWNSGTWRCACGAHVRTMIWDSRLAITNRVSGVRLIPLEIECENGHKVKASMSDEETLRVQHQAATQDSNTGDKP